MKKITAVGHRKGLRIAGNLAWILRLMSFYLGTILFDRSACQPMQRAEEPAVFILVGSEN